MRQLGIIVATVGLIAALYVGIYHGGRARNHVTSSSAPGAVAPTLVAEDIGGNKLDTSAYKGKVVLVNFWAAWCTPCTEEVPKLVSLQQRYGDRGFQAIGISMDDKPEALRQFYQTNKMNYPVVAGSQQIVQEYGGILGLPTTFLIGRDGRIHAKYAGLADFAKLENEVVSLLHAGP